MKKVTVLTHADYILPLTKELHRSGLMQIDPFEMEGMEKNVPDRSHIEELFSRVQAILELIRHEEPEDMKEMLLNPRPPEIFDVPEYSEEEVAKKANDLLPVIEDEIRKREEKLTRLRERQNALEEQKIELQPLRGMAFDLTMLGEGEDVTIVAGSTRDLDGLLRELDSPLIHVHHEGTKGDFSVIIIAHRTEVPKVEKARRQRFFDSVEMDLVTDSGELKGHPREIIREIETELIAINVEMKEIQEQYHSLYGEHRKDLLILKDEIGVLRDQYTVFENFQGTRTTTTFTGWVEDGAEDDLKALCEGITKGAVTLIMEEPEGNEAPTLLRNSSWARPFEPLVHMFSTPKYNELDTSMVVGPLFIIFFGLMLGDAGYGFIMLLMAFFILKVHGRVSEEMRDYGYFITLMGISTIVFGLIMGGLFYDSVQRFIYGDEALLLYPKFDLLVFSFPMDPMNEPTTIFLASLIIGLITLNIGVLLGAYHHWKQQDYHSLLTGDLSWFILEPGGILLIGYSMFGAFALSTPVLMLSVITVVVGLVLRVIHSKGLVMFDFTGFVGNVLSFARILALALATAGLALAINYFSGLLGGMQLLGPISPILILAGLLLFIVAHFMNTLLQALGAGIHSLRLNYVEFFSMFYEGGGKQFEPFTIERSYTQVVEKEANQ